MHVRYYQKTPGRWHLDLRFPDGRRLRPFGGHSEAEARKNSAGTIARALAGAGARQEAPGATIPVSQGVTLRGSFTKALRVREGWIQAKDKRGLETTYAALGLPDEFPTAGLTRDFVRELRAKWAKEPGKRKGTFLAPSTINHRLSMLSVLLEVEDLPPHNVKHLSTKESIRHFRVSPALFSTMVDWAQRAPQKDAKDFARLMVAGLNTGGRLSELLAAAGTLRGANWVAFTHTKTGLPRLVPLVPAALEAMTDPFPPSLNVDRVTALWAAMRRDLGLAAYEDFVFHILRHECASRMADDGKTAFHIMQLLGHASVKTSEKYVQMSIAGLAREMRVDLSAQSTLPACGELEDGCSSRYTDC